MKLLKENKRKNIIIFSCVFMFIVTLNHSHSVFAFTTESKEAIRQHRILNSFHKINYTPTKEELYSSPNWYTDYADSNQVISHKNYMEFKFQKIVTDWEGDRAWNRWFKLDNNVTDGKYYFEVDIKSSKDTNVYCTLGAKWCGNYNIKKDQWNTIQGYVDSNVSAHGNQLIFVIGQNDFRNNFDATIGDSYYLRNLVVSKIDI